MNNTSTGNPDSKPKILFSSVFGPYGVDDDYGRKSNKMELFHNQVTREQGIFSYRFNHSSFGLYFLAENTDVKSKILDFPSLKRFTKEVKNNYEYIGISFIIPNFKKAKKMAEVVRKISPNTKIILGGHGVNIPGIESMIEHDYMCRGEGVKFLRDLFGEDTEKPIKHPIMNSSFNRRIMGVPLPKASGILIPGVGCPNRCRFCATSHFFGDYTPFIKTGKDMYDICCEYEEKLGVTDFGVMDENFLKMKDRALELLEQIEKNKKNFTFGIFSSAETIGALGDIDLLVRLGVQFIWIGVESKKEVYEKNSGTDFKKLVFELRKRGISVMASAILFLEHHTKNTIWEDIDFAISLKPDYLQFMQLGPIPGTALYSDYDNQNKLLKDIHYEDQHGQDRIWFKHDHFTGRKTNEYLVRAFKKDYFVNGASFLRVIRTALMGYRYTKFHDNELVRNKNKGFVEIVKLMRYFVLSSLVFKENRATSYLIKNIRNDFRELIGRNSIKSKFFSIVVLFMGLWEFFKLHQFGDIRQPKFSVKV